MIFLNAWFVQAPYFRIAGIPLNTWNMEVMERKTLKQFHRDLSWSTRIFTLISIILGAGAFFLNMWDASWAVMMMLALAVVLFVESFAISFHRHPRLWRVVRWVLVLLLALLLLTG